MGHPARASPFVPALAAYVVLLSLIQVSVLASSVASLRLSRPFAAGIFVTALLAAWLVRRRLTSNGEVESPLAGISAHGWGWRLVGVFASLYVFLVVCALIVTDVSWDGNSYHLPVIQSWFQSGRVIWIEGPDVSILRNMNGYPKAAEVLSFFLCTLVHPALAKVHNLVYLPLGILGIASIASALGASRSAALAAGAALLVVPINLGQAATAYVDSAFSAAVIAWLAVTAHLCRPVPRHSILQALVLGCALGQVIGIKGTGLPLGALGSLALLGVHLGGRPAARSVLREATWWCGVGAVALAVGGFWYLRNLAHGQSPLYPVGVSIAGVTLYPGYDAYAPAGAYAVDGWLADWPVPVQVAIAWLQGVWYWPASIVGFDMRLGGLGFMWLLGCVPAVVALVWRRIHAHADWRDELASQPLWLLVTIVSAGLILLPCPWWSRFTIWVYGLGLPCLAAVQRLLVSRWSRAWLVTCAALAFLEAGIVLARWQVPLLSSALRSDRAPGRRIPSHFYPPWALRGTILEQIAQGPDTVGIGPLEWYEEPFAGVLSQPLGARQIYFLPADLDADFAAWYARVRPRYVVMNSTPEVPAPMARLQPQVQQTHSLTILKFW